VKAHVVLAAGLRSKDAEVRAAAERTLEVVMAAAYERHVPRPLRFASRAILRRIRGAA
jgi:hypothetical protein